MRALIGADEALRPFIASNCEALSNEQTRETIQRLAAPATELIMQQVQTVETQMREVGYAWCYKLKIRMSYVTVK